MAERAPVTPKVWRFLMAAFSLILLASRASAQTRATPPTPAQPSPTPAASANMSVPLQAQEFAADIEARKIAFATAISSRTPVGASDEFDADVQSVYFWNQLVLKQAPARIKHEWYFNGDKISESIFDVHYHQTRVWSRHRVRPGHWRVEIREADSGRLIAVGAFVVRK